MSRAFFKYYTDLTIYNLAFSLIAGGALQRQSVAIISFGTFGMLVALFCFQSFQSNQYYFYFNLGLSKSKMISRVWIINLILSLLILLILG